MRDYGSVHTRFWIDSEIQSLSNEAKLLALYLLTGTHTTMLGCFRIPLGYVAEDLGWEIKVAENAFDELVQTQFISRDFSTGWCLIHNFLKWNSIENANQGKSIIRLFEQVPTHSTVFKPLVKTLLLYGTHLEEAFVNRLQTVSKELQNSSETVSKPLPKPFRNQDQEQDKKQNQKQGQNQEGSAELCEHNSTQVVDNFSQPIISIPLANKAEFPIFQNQIDEWQELYPGVDVLQALRNIRGWNDANPRKRKTQHGILKHINAWLAKSQDQHANPRNLKPHNLNTLFEYNKLVGQQWLDEV